MHAVQDGRALRLKAERLGRHSNARRCIQSWAAAASAQAAASERAHESAVRHWRRHQKRRVVTAWMDQTALGWQRKQALWRVMVLVAWAEDMVRRLTPTTGVVNLGQHHQKGGPQAQLCVF
jgi:hypothetical protein